MQEWLKHGPSRHCQGNDFCVATGPTTSVGLLCIGGPRSRAIGECRMCAHFYCGACATRKPERVDAGTSHSWWWRLCCPRCGLPLGDPLTSRAVFHASSSGVIGGCEQRNGTMCLVDTKETIVAALSRQHRLHGLGELASLYTAASREGRIAAVDRALSEAPGEPLAWLFKFVLCTEGKHRLAAQTAFRGVARCGAGDPLMIALLGKDISFDRLGKPTALRKGLDQFAADLAFRAARLNPELAAFDARVQHYVSGKTRLGDYVRMLHSQQTQRDVVRAFLRVLQMEIELDSAATEADRAGLLNALMPALSKDETDALLARSVALRLGSISTTDYYAELQALVERHGVDLAPWPHMSSYLRYVSEAGAIDFAELHRQNWEAEQGGYASRSANPGERATILDVARARVAYGLLDYLEGKSAAGQLGANVARNPTAMKQLAERLEQAAALAPVGLFGRIKRLFKK